MRLQTGEPYLIFVDTANKSMPKHQTILRLDLFPHKKYFRLAGIKII
jgi:hypothetical protein